MKIKLNFPINLGMAFNKANSTMVGGIYPITMDGKQIGTGKVLECNDFSLVIEVNKEAEKFYNDNFTQDERVSFELA